MNVSEDAMRSRSNRQGSARHVALGLALALLAACGGERSRSTEARSAASGNECSPVPAHPKHAQFACTTCHQCLGVVSFDPAGLAVKAGGAPPSFDPATKTCTNTYCHGRGGTTPAPRWTQTLSGCESCHMQPPLETNHRNYHWGLPCTMCHPGTTWTSTPAATHVNHRSDVVNPATGATWTSGWNDCGPCHSY